MLQDSGGGVCGLEQQVDADGKICGIQKAGAFLFNQLADFVQIPIPAGGPDHHVFTGRNASLDIFQDSLRDCEIDYGIYVTQFLGSERGGSGVFRRTQQCNLVAAFTRYFRDQRAGFAAS
jgi:hypothetical protein